MAPSFEAGNPLFALLLACDEGGALAANQQQIQLRQKSELYGPDRIIDYLVFPETAVVSLLSPMQNGAAAEVGMVGREGFVGLAAWLGCAESPDQAIVQVGGTARRLRPSILTRAAAQSPPMRAALNLYTQARLAQAGRLSACNRLHRLDMRLARWLLSVHDRVDGNEFRFVHDFVAGMLGTGRPTLTEAVHRLQAAGIIEHAHRTIFIRDRRHLERCACECYHVIERVFDRCMDVRRAVSLMASARTPPSEPTRSEVFAGEESADFLREIASRLLVACVREQTDKDLAQAKLAARISTASAVSDPDLLIPVRP